MTQKYAAKFTTIKSQLTEFINWVSENQLKSKGYKEEEVRAQIASLCQATEVHLKGYNHSDYKVKFIEWIINFITREVAALDSGKKKSETTRIGLIIDTIRIEFKNRFEHELVDYPFVFENVRYIHWKWRYREILMILYSLKELGAFNESTKELDMSNLKDLIYRFGFADWQHLDLESSWKDTQTAWSRIMNRSTSQESKRDNVVSSAENAAYQTLKKFSLELQNALNQYDNCD
jgi:hypothetical protein